MARRHNKTGRSKSGPPFVQLRKFMLESPAWLSLSCAARSAYVEVERIYNGTNNGTIGVGVRFLAERLRCSNDTASRALRELDDARFIETVKLGGFTRRNRKASEYRLTIHRCDLTGHMPSKAFMQWSPPLSDQKDNTVRLEGQLKENCAFRSDQKDRQRQKAPAHCPTTGTHIESYHTPSQNGPAARARGGRP